MNSLSDESIKSLNLLARYLNEENNLQNSFTCELSNLSSILLKHVNVIVLNEFDSLANFSTPITNSNSTNNITDVSTNSSIRSDYDYSGAFIYIIAILCFYGFFVVVLIFIQTKMNNMDDFGYSDDPRVIAARNILKRIRSEDVKKEALEDLRNPMFRQKIWDIYFDNPNKYKIRRTDSKRIQQIDRKLKQYYTTAGVEAPNRLNSSSTVQSNATESFKFSDTSSLTDRPGSFINRQFSGPLTRTNENNLFLLRDLTKFEAPASASYNHYYTVNSLNKHQNFSNINHNTYHPSGLNNVNPLQQIQQVVQQPQQSSNNNNTNNNSNLPNSSSLNRFKIEKPISKNIV